MAKEKQLHVVIRYSDSLHDVDTINEHQKVINKSGSVWFGKIGKPIGKSLVMRLNKQIEDGGVSKLYLIQYQPKFYTVALGNITNVIRTFPKSEKNLIPKYYFEKQITKYIQVWIKLNILELKDQEILEDLVINSSFFPLRESLGKSMAGYFIVRSFP